MKKRIAIVALFGAGLFINLSHASEATPASGVAAQASPTPLLDKAMQEERMRQVGIEPGTKKAEMFADWVSRARQDPAFQRYVLIHGNNGFDNVMAQHMLISGLARASAADRSRYWLLVEQLFRERAPQDCWGEVLPDRVTRKLVTFENMTDSEASEYLDITYRAMLAAVHDEPVVVPSATDVQKANVDFGRILESAVSGDAASVKRLAAVLAQSPEATIVDKCWALGEVIHSVNALPEKSREAIQSNGTATAYAKTLPAHPVTPPATPPSGAPVTGGPAVARRL